MGKNSVLGSPSQTMGEEGTDLALDLVGSGESPLVVRARRRCKCFVVGVYKLGYFEGVEDSCFVKGWRRYLTVRIVAGIDYRMKIGLVVGMEESAGRRLVLECVSWKMSLMEDQKRTGLVDHSCFEMHCIVQLPNSRMMCHEGRSYPVTACDGLVDLDVDSEDQERTDPAVDHKEFAKPESAVHMRVRLSRNGCPDDHIAKSQRGSEHYCRLNFQVVPASVVYAVH